jgi:hypothetical protein
MPRDKVNLKALLWDAKIVNCVRHKVITDNAVEEYEKLFKIIKLQLSTLDPKALVAGDHVITLEGGTSKEYKILSAGVTQTHHRAYDLQEMRIKVLNTEYLADSRQICVCKYGPAVTRVVP